MKNPKPWESSLLVQEDGNKQKKKKKLILLYLFGFGLEKDFRREEKMKTQSFSHTYFPSTTHDHFKPILEKNENHISKLKIFNTRAWFITIEKDIPFLSNFQNPEILLQKGKKEKKKKRKATKKAVYPESPLFLSRVSPRTRTIQLS